MIPVECEKIEETELEFFHNFYHRQYFVPTGSTITIQIGIGVIRTAL